MWLTRLDRLFAADTAHGWLAAWLREYQVLLFRDRKLSPGTIEGQAAMLRFLLVKTLRRPYLPDAIPFPKHHKRLPRCSVRKKSPASSTQPAT